MITCVNWRLQPLRPSTEKACGVMAVVLNHKFAGVRTISPSDGLAIETTIGQLMMPAIQLAGVLVTNPRLYWNVRRSADVRNHLRAMENFLIAQRTYDDLLSLFYVRLGLGFLGQKPAIDTIASSLFCLRLCQATKHRQSAAKLDACDAVLRLWSAGNVLLGFDQDDQAVVLCS